MKRTFTVSVILNSVLQSDVQEVKNRLNGKLRNQFQTAFPRTYMTYEVTYEIEERRRPDRSDPSIPRSGSGRYKRLQGDGETSSGDSSGGRRPGREHSRKPKQPKTIRAGRKPAR